MYLRCNIQPTINLNLPTDNWQQPTTNQYPNNQQLMTRTIVTTTTNIVITLVLLVRRSSPCRTSGLAKTTQILTTAK